MNSAFMMSTKGFTKRSCVRTLNAHALPCVCTWMTAASICNRFMSGTELENRGRIQGSDRIDHFFAKPTQHRVAVHAAVPGHVFLHGSQLHWRANQSKGQRFGVERGQPAEHGRYT